MLKKDKPKKDEKPHKVSISMLSSKDNALVEMPLESNAYKTGNKRKDQGRITESMQVLVHQEYDDRLNSKRIRSVQSYRVIDGDRLSDPIETVLER